MDVKYITIVDLHSNFYSIARYQWPGLITIRVDL